MFQELNPTCLQVQDLTVAGHLSLPTDNATTTLIKHFICSAVSNVYEIKNDCSHFTFAYFNITFKRYSSILDQMYMHLCYLVTYVKYIMKIMYQLSLNEHSNNAGIMIIQHLSLGWNFVETFQKTFL